MAGRRFLLAVVLGAGVLHGISIARSLLPAQDGLKFIHVAPDAGSIDIYVITPGSGIAGLSPQLSNLTYTNAAGPMTPSAGNYEVVMTQSGTQNPVPGLDVTYTWTAGQVRTIMILDNVAGGAPFQQLVLADAN